MKIILKILKEFLIGMLEVFLSSGESKIGFAIFCFIFGVVLVIIPNEGGIKYFFTISGILLLANSIKLVVSRIKEIKNENNTWLFFVKPKYSVIKSKQKNLQFIKTDYSLQFENKVGAVEALIKFHQLLIDTIIK